MGILDIYLSSKAEAARKSQRLRKVSKSEQRLLARLLQSAPFLPVGAERDSAGSAKSNTGISISLVQNRPGGHRFTQDRASHEEYPGPSLALSYKSKDC